MLLTKSCLALSCGLGWGNSAIESLHMTAAVVQRLQQDWGFQLFTSLFSCCLERGETLLGTKRSMFWQPFYSLVCSVEWSLPCTHLSFVKGMYRYFVKGRWQKGTWQSWKVSWVVFSSLFFKRILKRLARVVMDVCLQLLKLSKQKQVGQLQCQERCIDHIPFNLLGIAACTFFFPTTFLEIAVYQSSICF